MKWRRLAVGAPVAALALAALACSSPPEVSRSQIGDTVVVENALPLIRDTIDPVEVARVGRADGPLNELFTAVSEFAVGPDGDVLVFDPAAGIRRYAPDGRFLRSIAGLGQGPREVGSVVGLDVAEDGRLAVYDLGNQRVSVFAASNADPLVLPKPQGMPRNAWGTLLFHIDGSLWIGLTPDPPLTGGVQHPRAAFARITSGGEIVDTVFTPANGAADCTALSEWQHRAGFWEDRRERYIPKSQWALGRDGTFIFGCPKTYSFDVYRPDGSIVRILRESTPVPISEEEKEFHRALGRFGRGSDTGLPDTRPAYAAIIPSGDGRVWVWPNGPSVREALPVETAQAYGIRYTWDPATSGAFDVFDAEGTWLAVVRLPDGARYSGFPTDPGVVIRGDTIWAVATDSLDVQYVVRYEARGLTPPS